jgi:hypothetical protein
MNMLSRRFIGLGVLVVVVLAATACTSRYRLDMFTVVGNERARIKVEKTEYYLGVVLGDPKSQDKVVRGNGNCLVLVTGGRGQSIVDKAEDIITFDRYERFRVFLQLAAAPQADTILLSGNSFVQQLGRYEFSDDERMYFPTNGTLVIDSIARDRLFGTLNGTYKNAKNNPLIFEGQFKAKIAE